MKHRVAGIVVMGALALLVSMPAYAKRLGSGTSMGKQQTAIATSRQAQPSASNAPPSSTADTPAATSSASGSPAAAPGVASMEAGVARPAGPSPATATTTTSTPTGAPAPGSAPARSRWLAPLAGIAAGLGIGALLGHFGLGGELMTVISNLMIIGLFVFAAMFVWRALRGRAVPSRPQPAYAERTMGPNTVADLGRESMVNPQPSAPLRLDATLHPGNGLRPIAPVSAFGIPNGFDVEAFTRNAKVYFVRLQAAWDAGNLKDIREFSTPEMFAQIRQQLEDRGATPNQTDVVTLEAQVLGVTTLDDLHMASMRFHGMLREQTGGAAEPFDEVWNLTKPVQGAGGWVLAGIQQVEAIADLDI